MVTKIPIFIPMPIPGRLWTDTTHYECDCTNLLDWMLFWYSFSNCSVPTHSYHLLGRLKN